MSLVERWAAGDTTLGVWLTSDSPTVAEVAGDAGFDYANVDMQHGFADYRSFVAMLRAMLGSPTTPICRVPWNEPGIIGRVLDAGAMGVIIPMVNTVEEAERAVLACRYAPDGRRSHGPLRAARVHGPDYRATANERVACIPMIETAEALGNLDAIADVPGIDALYIGPADLSLTLGLEPAGDHDDPAFTDALAAVLAACDRRGLVAGIQANPQLAAKRVEQGFRMVTVTTDLQALSAGFAVAQAAVETAPQSGATDSLY